MSRKQNNKINNANQAKLFGGNAEDTVKLAYIGRQRSDPRTINANDGVVSMPILPYSNPVYPSYPWVYFGEDNNYPQNLVDLSFITTHQQMLNMRQAYIYGDGLTWDIEDPVYTQKFEDFMRNCTDKGGLTLKQLVKRWCYDYAMWNTYAFSVNYELKTDYVDTEHDFVDEYGNTQIDPVTGQNVKQKQVVTTRNKIAKLRYIDPATIRLSAIYIQDNVYQSVYTSPDWRYWTQGGRYDPIEKPLFGCGSETEPTEIFYYRGNIKTQNVYPLPKYVAGLMAIQAENELEKLILSSLKSRFNGFMTVDTFKKLEGEERDKYIRSFERQHKGNDTLNSVYFNFIEAIDGNTNPLLSKISFNAPPFQTEAFIAAANEINKRIMSAHGMIYQLAGITSGDTLGSDAGLLANTVKLYDMTENNSARQDIIAGLHEVLEYNGFPRKFIDTVAIKPFDFSSIQ